MLDILIPSLGEMESVWNFKP